MYNLTGIAETWWTSSPDRSAARTGHVSLEVQAGEIKREGFTTQRNSLPVWRFAMEWLRDRG